MLGVITGLGLALCLFVGKRYSFAMVLPLFVPGVLVAMCLLERVTVVGNRSARYCPACRYDLTGTLSAGIEHCPECGRDLAPEPLARTPPDA